MLPCRLPRTVPHALRIAQASYAKRSSADSTQPAQDEKTVVFRHLVGEFEGTSVFELNRPKVRNAISYRLMEDLMEVIDHVKAKNDVTSVILRSGHPGMFCAGADLKERISLSDQQYKRWSLTVRAVFSELACLPVPVLAAVDGYALGGGLEMALAADIRVAASDITIGFPETGLAIIPGAGGTTRLPRLIGSSLAKELLFTSRRFDAVEALRLGVVSHVVQQNQDGDAAYRKCLDLVRALSKDRAKVARVKTDLTHNTE